MSFRDPDPARAKKVVESLAAIFVESNQGRSRLGTDEAKRFIEEQIKIYEEKLEEAENRLKEFRLRHLGQTTAGSDYFTRMEELRTRLKEPGSDFARQSSRVMH